MNWLVYNLYPEGKGKQTEKLNECRIKIESKLKSFLGKYNWFTIVHMGEGRVKIGIHEKNEDETIKKIEEEMKTDYPSLQIENGSEKYYELMAIASEMRDTLEERLPISEWTINNVSLLNHFILNPQGYDFEANVHIRALLNIKDKVTSDKLREIIKVIEGSSK